MISYQVGMTAEEVAHLSLLVVIQIVITITNTHHFLQEYGIQIAHSGRLYAQSVAINQDSLSWVRYLIGSIILHSIQVISMVDLSGIWVTR